MGCGYLCFLLCSFAVGMFRAVAKTTCMALESKQVMSFFCYYGTSIILFFDIIEDKN